MGQYIKNLIQKLYEIYGYDIVELGNVPGLCSEWGAVKREENEVELIFFSSVESSYILNMESFRDFLSNVLDCEYVRPIQVLIDGKLKLERDENGELHLNYKINPQCELILINNVDNKILYFSPSLEEKVNELAQCMNYNKGNRSKDRKSKVPIMTYTLIALNILAYLLTAYLSGNIVDSNINVLILLGAKVNELIASGEYYRLVTCMFLHGGIIHLSLNMYALYSLGPLVENVYGKAKYIFIYFLSGIMSSLFSYFFSTSVSIGASGAIFGLLGAALIFAVKMKNKIGKGFITNILSVIAINLVIGLSISNVDNFGHMGGLLGGMASSFVIFKRGDGTQLL